MSKCFISGLPVDGEICVEHHGPGLWGWRGEAVAKERPGWKNFSRTMRFRGEYKGRKVHGECHVTMCMEPDRRFRDEFKEWGIRFVGTGPLCDQDTGEPIEVEAEYVQ